VKGKKIIPKTGTIRLEKAEAYLAGLKSHHTIKAARGPRNKNKVNMQHIFSPLDNSATSATLKILY
jgi:hypothetical protein